MNNRSNFVKVELDKIYNNLKSSFEYVDLSGLENDKKFIKVIELLMELHDKSINLNNHLRNNYLFI